MRVLMVCWVVVVVVLVLAVVVVVGVVAVGMADCSGYRKCWVVGDDGGVLVGAWLLRYDILLL